MMYTLAFSGNCTPSSRGIKTVVHDSFKSQDSHCASRFHHRNDGARNQPVFQRLFRRVNFAAQADTVNDDGFFIMKDICFSQDFTWEKWPFGSNRISSRRFFVDSD